MSDKITGTVGIETISGPLYQTISAQAGIQPIEGQIAYIQAPATSLLLLSTGGRLNLSTGGRLELSGS